MTISYLKHDEIDKAQWDRCIAKSFNGNVYGWSWYLDIVCPGWEALVMGKYAQVFPLCHGSKFGFKYLYQPPFTQQLGLFSIGSPGGDRTDVFLENLQHHYRFAEINLNSFNQVQSDHCRVIMRCNYELSLIQPYQDTRLLYSDNTLRNIRKAENDGVTYAIHADPKSVMALFRDNKGRELRNFTEPRYRMLEQLVYRCLAKNIALSAGAFDKFNQLIAGAFLLRSHHRLVLIFTAAGDAAKASGAMHLLIDNVIREHSHQPLILDFEGSDLPGLARFYASFGSKEVHYPQIFINRYPLAIRLGIRFIKTIRSVF